MPLIFWGKIAGLHMEACLCRCSQLRGIFQILPFVTKPERGREARLLLETKRLFHVFPKLSVRGRYDRYLKMRQKCWVLNSISECYSLCECVTVAMNGCWLMWLGDCCIRLCWWGLWSCWENCTGCSAARLPATLLITGTDCDCDVFKPAMRKKKKPSVRLSDEGMSYFP